MNDPLDVLVASGDPTGLDAIFSIDGHLPELREDIELLILQTMDDAMGRIDEAADVLISDLDSEYAAREQDARYIDSVGLIEGRAAQQKSFCCNWMHVALISRMLASLHQIPMYFSGIVRQEKYGNGKDSEIEKLKEEYLRRFGFSLYDGPHHPRIKACAMARHKIVHANSSQDLDIPVEGKAEPNTLIQQYLPECLQNGRIVMTPESIRQTAAQILEYIDWVLNKVSVNVAEPIVPCLRGSGTFESLCICWKELIFAKQQKQWAQR